MRFLMVINLLYLFYECFYKILFIGNKKIIKKLLYEGADLLANNNKEESPYDYSIKFNKVKIQNLFDEYIEEDVNQVCITKPGLRKYKKSYLNFILFILLHLIGEGIIFLIILPCKINLFFS
jgi:hypothetical protein